MKYGSWRRDLEREMWTAGLTQVQLEEDAWRQHKTELDG